MDDIDDLVAPACTSPGVRSDYSLEMTGRDVPALTEALPHLQPGTRMNVTYLASEDLATRVAAAAAVRGHGLVPVPHISARRLETRGALSAFLTALAAVDAVEDVFVVGGDPEQPSGPYPDALSVIRSGLLAEVGVRRISVAGYPEGHPHISTEVLWSSLHEKVEAAAELQTPVTIITQFGFDVDATLHWLQDLRKRGIAAQVRIGLPGPAGVRRLLSYAKRFGVASSAGIARKYGFSLTNLLGTAGPDRFVADLSAGHSPSLHGEVGFHLYTFGGLAATSTWLRDHLDATAGA